MKTNQKGVINYIIHQDITGLFGAVMSMKFVIKKRQEIIWGPKEKNLGVLQIPFS